ncbi:IQ domain-containing protein D-like [Fopius arisanus]|uniref:Dynein regulatory complex protein 10 n=1 Tax=Fopius arisanus TaxID=64838 RepID=A0A9R1TRV0_9HYME|nr:PREDICTED: IQ domain-containing protein D-like [Fopius arisanus]
MGEISEKIVETIVSNIENVLERLLTDVKGLPEEKKSDKTWIFLRHLMYLIEHVLFRLRNNPNEEKTREDFYWALWHENRDTQVKLTTLRAAIEGQRKLNQGIIDRIHGNFIRNCQLVSRIDDKFSVDAVTIRLKFERMQLNEYKKSEDRQNDLKEICGVSRNRLQNYRLSLRKLEQETFQKRLKISGKFLSLLNRYDTEIGGRRKTLSDLESILNDLTKKIHQLQENMNEQSNLYNSCFNEQEERRLAEIMAKLELITGVIAAKKIQRWWRSILPALKSRKKKKAKKSKKEKKRKK